MARTGRRRRGRGPGIRHRQVEHVPLALGRVRVAAAVPGRVEVRVAADEPEAVDLDPGVLPQQTYFIRVFK